MQEVNYIKHLKSVFIQFSKDNRLNPTHISLYIALFQLWNVNRFPEEFYINREEIMKYSKIGSKSTYHRCIKELSHWDYVVYIPSHNPYKGSKVKILKFETTPVQVKVHNHPKNETSIEQALVPIYKHIQTKENKNVNKQGNFKKSELSDLENNSKHSGSIPITDNLKTTNNKNYSEPL